MDQTRRLTKTVVESLRYQGRTYTAKNGSSQHERFIVWEAGNASFGVRVSPAGKRTYVIRYRRGGRKRLHTIGEHGVAGLSLQKARSEAGDLLAGVRTGGSDPVEDRRRVDIDTVRSAWEHFEQTALKGVAESTALNYAGTYRKHLAKLSGRSLDSITAHEIERLYARLAAKSVYAANDAIRLLRRLFKVARVPDPSADATLGGRRPGTLAKEKTRTRYLSADELKALAEALDAESDRDVADYVRLLLVTGARPFEWRLAEWRWLDLKKGIMRIPSEVAKTRPEEESDVRELPPAALEILERVKARQTPLTPFVFPQGGGEQPHHRNWMSKPWRRITKAAKLEGVTLYTLRHTFGSWSVEGGLSLPATAALMGHRDTTTTLRYAHALRDARKTAAERVSSSLTAMMEGKEAEIVRHPSAGAA